MVRIILIFILASIPALLGFWIIRRSKRRFQARMRRIRHRAYHQAITSESSEPYPLTERSDRFIGEISCQYNARSPHLRCAVNPSGPCEGCPYYKARE
ncbi:DUF6464 family protein [Gloeothece verrucosa]|uniref:Uncharacterized protein n=1 Tax=Gloeothece verrucosa (strain PCC 7822) TaxID=497965 RepID=E0UIH7_GLOV7|nr:DUF6464 family protein [Gloeothece verrucosa]ADN12171.1 conserved hypothetical protein [Gloeothece verrucosa PCC 7822]